MTSKTNPFTRVSTGHHDLSDRSIPIVWSQRSIPRSIVDAHRSRPAFPRAASPVGQSSPDGVLAREVVAMIDTAKETVILCSFLFSDPSICDALLRAARRGVRGYVMLAAETRLKSEPPEDDRSDWSEEQRRRLEEFKRLLNALAGWVVVRAADSFHAKFVLVDPRSSPAGMMLTCNLTKEALTRNEEIAVRLEEDEVRDLFRIARWGFWEQSGHEALEPGRLESCSPLGEVDHPGLDSGLLCTTRDAQLIRRQMLELIELEPHRIVVCSYGFDADHPVIDALVSKAQSGVQITVLARPRRAAMPALIRLADAGATVLGFKWLHAKALWTEGHGAIVTSANLEPHGLDDGFEVGVLLSGARAGEVGALLRQWVEAAPWQLRLSAKRKDIIGAVQIWDAGKGGLTDGQVIAEHVEMSSLTAESAELVAKTESRAELPDNGVLKGTDGRITIPRLWTRNTTIGPPVLHPKAKPLKRPRTQNDAPSDDSSGPQLFKEPDGTTVVAVSSEADIQPAIALKQQARARRIVLRE